MTRSQEAMMFLLGAGNNNKTYAQVDNTKENNLTASREKGPRASTRKHDQNKTNRVWEGSSSITTYNVSGSNSSPIPAVSFSATSTQNPSYFDVRLNTSYKDMIIIPEDEFEENKVFLSGYVVVSFVRPMNIKQISLDLVGNFKLDFIQTAGKQGYTTIIKESRPIFESSWPNILASSHGTVVNLANQKKKRRNTTSGNNDAGLRPTMSSDSLGSFTSNTSDSSNTPNQQGGSSQGSSVSATRLQNSDLTTKPLLKSSSSAPSIIKKLGLDYYYFSGSNNSGKFAGQTYNENTNGFKKKIVKVIKPGDNISDIQNGNEDESTVIDFYSLDAGNYMIPFSIEIPNNAMIPETVEGLQSGSVLYTMQATIDTLDKGKIRHAKYVRVFKTLKVNNWAIHENLYVGQSFEEKLQYEIRLPSRAIPIGGETPISIKLFPFQKNYRLLKVTAQLIQFYAVTDQHDQIFEEEQSVLKLTMQKFQNIQSIEADTGKLLGDVHIRSIIKIPKNLKQITQDCSVMEKNNTDYSNKKLILVRHKLNIQISLMSPANKITEINCKMPLLVYVSPYVPIETRKVVLDKMKKIHFRPNETTPFFKKLVQPPRPTTNVSSFDDETSELQRENENLIRYFPQDEFRMPPAYTERHSDSVLDGETAYGVSHQVLNSTDDLPGAKPLDEHTLKNINNVPSYEHTFYDIDNMAAHNTNFTTTTTTTTTNPDTPPSLTRDSSEDASSSSVQQLETRLLNLSTDFSPRYER